MDDVDVANQLEEARIFKGLVAIKNEVTQVNEDDYCMDCGDEIDEDRRRAMPSAKRCLNCQKQWEKLNRVKRF